MAVDMIRAVFGGGRRVRGVGLFHAVRRVLQLQALTVLLVSASALAWGKYHGMSALLGGLIAFLPNAYFAVKFGRKDPGKTASQVVKAFYFGEATKLLFTALLFVIVFQLPGILPLPLFIAFAAVMAVFWVALLLRT